MGVCTLLAQGHLKLHCFEVIRDVGLDFSAHAFPSPLLEAVQFLIDIHGEGELDKMAGVDKGLPVGQVRGGRESRRREDCR